MVSLTILLEDANVKLMADHEDAGTRYNRMQLI